MDASLCLLSEVARWLWTMTFTVGSNSRCGQVNYITVSRHSMAHHGRKHQVAPDGEKEVKGLYSNKNIRNTSMVVQRSKDFFCCCCKMTWRVLGSVKTWILSQRKRCRSRSWHHPSLIHNQVRDRNTSSPQVFVSRLLSAAHCSCRNTVLDLTEFFINHPVILFFSTRIFS